MIIILSDGEKYKNVKQCLVTYRDGQARTYTDIDTSLLYINASEIVSLAMQL